LRSGSYLPGTRIPERAPDCKGLRGQIRAVRVRSVKVSSGQFISGIHPVRVVTTVIRDTTVYIDTTGTTYTQLQRGPHLNFFFLYLSSDSETNRCRIWVAHPSIFQYCLSRSQGKYDGETAPCPLVGRVREPCSVERHPSRHSGIEASFYAHK